jgi:hypothetical protein
MQNGFASRNSWLIRLLAWRPAPRRDRYPRPRRWHRADCQGKITHRGIHKTPRAQFPHPSLGYAEAVEDFGIVLAELGDDGAHLHVIADPDRGVDVRDFAQFRIARVLNEAVVAHLRVGEHLCVVVDRPAGHSCRIEHADPVTGGFRCEHRCHLCLQCLAVLHPSLVGRKTRALAPLQVPQSLRTARPDRLSGGSYHQIAVFRSHALIGSVLAMARALAGRLLVVGEPLGTRPRAEPDCGLEQRAFDEAPDTVR